MTAKKMQNVKKHPRAETLILYFCTSKSNLERHNLPWLEPHTAWTCTSVWSCLDLQTFSCPCRSHTEHSPLFFCRAHILHTFWPNASPEDNHTMDNQSHCLWRILFILKQSTMQPVTFMWLSQSSNTLLTWSNDCQSFLTVVTLKLLDKLLKYPWDVAVKPSESVQKWDLLWIHASFRSYSLECWGCCTVFQFCQTRIPFLCFSLTCTLFPVWGFYLVTRGIMQQCVICFNDL